MQETGRPGPASPPLDSLPLSRDPTGGATQGTCTEVRAHGRFSTAPCRCARSPRRGRDRSPGLTDGPRSPQAVRVDVRTERLRHAGDARRGVRDAALPGRLGPHAGLRDDGHPQHRACRLLHARRLSRLQHGPRDGPLLALVPGRPARGWGARRPGRALPPPAHSRLRACLRVAPDLRPLLHDRRSRALDLGQQPASGAGARRPRGLDPLPRQPVPGLPPLHPGRFRR